MGKIIRQVSGRLEIDPNMVQDGCIRNARDKVIADYWFDQGRTPKKYDGKHVRLTLELLEDK